MRNVIGIVAEYNPFHNGHALHLEETRAILGAACPVVCVMSGDFAQRGTPAVYSKFARAEAAVRCGVDLVLELRTAQGAELVKAVNALEGVRSVCLMSHDGEASF